jgi:hypothetical protein
LLSKYFIPNRSQAVNVFVADLDEDGPGVSEEIPGDGKSVSEVSEVAVDSVAPKRATVGRF